MTDKVEEVDTAGLVEHALQQLYGEETGDSVPKEVLVPALPGTSGRPTRSPSG